MATDDRPLSPHLSVYRPQLTSVLSILHRITGFGLALGAVAITWWLMAALAGETAFAQFHAAARSFAGQLLLFGWAWAFIYHILNGLRHLVWDTGRWLDLKSAYASGWAVFFSSVVLSVLFWLAVRIAA